MFILAVKNFCVKDGVCGHLRHSGLLKHAEKPRWFR